MERGGYTSQRRTSYAEKIATCFDTRHFFKEPEQRAVNIIEITFYDFLRFFLNALFNFDKALSK